MVTCSLSSLHQISALSQGYDEQHGGMHACAFLQIRRFMASCDNWVLKGECYTARRLKLSVL